MAYNILRGTTLDTEDVIKEALEKQYSKQGEMFNGEKVKDYTKMKIVKMFCLFIVIHFQLMYW